eukprot:349738-Chlamydomonas_euryale.AAC.8
MQLSRPPTNAKGNKGGCAAIASHQTGDKATRAFRSARHPGSGHPAPRPANARDCAAHANGAGASFAAGATSGLTAAWPRAAGFAGVSGTCKTTACPPPRLALGGAFTAPMPTQPRRRSTASRAVKSADGAVAEQNGADADSLRQLADVTSAVDAALGTILSESAEGAQAPVTVPTSELRAKVEVAIERLSTGLLERETEVNRIAGRREMGRRRGAGWHRLGALVAPW